MSDISEKLLKIEKELSEMKLRTKRSERDLGWADSLVRKLLVVSFVYVISALIFFVIDQGDFLVLALIPAASLVVFSLLHGLVRSWWEKRQ